MGTPDKVPEMAHRRKRATHRDLQAARRARILAPMNRRSAIACTLVAVAIPLGSSAAPAAPQVVVLVTEAEYVAGKAAPERGSTRALPQRITPNPNAPRIELLAPEMADRPLAVPFPISVRFMPAAGRDIVGRREFSFEVA